MTFANKTQTFAASSGESAPVLGRRALNRALLARQMLLKRERRSALEAIAHLVGLQAQAPLAPYYCLWSRIADFRQDELSGLLQDKKAVRIALMRSTIHLVTADDCLQLRPWVQSALDRGFQGTYGKRLQGLQLAELAEAGRTLVEASPLTFSELGKRLAGQWPERDPEALAAAVRTLVPLVQPPPRGLWGESGQAAHMSAEAWLGRPFSGDSQTSGWVLRYLAAFGPASVKDMQVWSGLTRLKEEIERLRPQLAVFRDDNGVELFDLPDAPRPDGDCPAPARFIGEYDNILLSHADRSRIISEDDRKRVFSVNGIIRPTFLVDGFVHGTWKLVRERGSALLKIEPFRKLETRDQQALAEEGGKLLRFAAADAASCDLEFMPLSASHSGSV